MDVRADTREHIEHVQELLRNLAQKLRYRGIFHDISKFCSPEAEMFEEWRPQLDVLSVDSPEYKEALVKMGDALKHHYEVNRHHPEHFENGLSGMNLVDLAEMICDWVAAAGRKGERVNMEWACKRFGLEPNSTIHCIINNTIQMLSEQSEEQDILNEVNQ